MLPATNMPKTVGLSENKSRKRKANSVYINTTEADGQAVESEPWVDVELRTTEISDECTNQQRPTSSVCDKSGKKPKMCHTGHDPLSQLDPQPIIEHTDNIASPYQCGFCHISYSSPQILHTHILRDHKKHTSMPEPEFNGIDISPNTESNLEIKDEDDAEDPEEYITSVMHHDERHSSHSNTSDSELSAYDLIASPYDVNTVPSAISEVGQASTLSNIALMVARIAANQEALDRRIGKIEKNIGLILRAMPNQSSDGTKSVDMARSRPPISRFKPINTIDELNAFEHNLKNPVFYQELFEKVKLVCNDATLSAINLSYSIVDAMFSRPLFLNISWLGGTKSDVRKIAFKHYKRTLGFFIAIVRLHHPDWSDISMEEFFKKRIISCATSRAKTTPKRLSREKHRKRC